MGRALHEFDDYRGVWVFIEENEGKIEGVSLELLRGRAKTGGKVTKFL